MSKRLFKTLVAVLAIAAAAADPAWGQNSTTYNVTFSGFLVGYMNTTVSVTSLPQTFTSVDVYDFQPWNVVNDNCFNFTGAPVTSGGEGKVSANFVGGKLSITVSGTFEGTATIHVTGEGDMSNDVYVSCVAPPQPHTVRFAAGNDGWTVTDVDSARSATAPAILQNVMAGDSLVVTAPDLLPGKVKSVKAVKYVPPMNEVPMTIEAITAGTVVVQGPKSGMKYTLNGGDKTAVTSDAITVAVGDKVAFYGNGTSITSYSGTKITGGTADVKVYGNLMSLVNEEHFDTVTTLTTGYEFYNLFRYNAHLKDASGLLLPATTLAPGCYNFMFNGCTSLTTAPALPATTLASECYYSMFTGCAALTTAPELPATTMKGNCYSCMFQGCSSLTTVPALPATELAESCYSYMFMDCAALTTAPALPATTLANECYNSMFQDCSSLTTAPVLPAQTLVSHCYYYMFYNCRKLNSVTCLATSGINQDNSTASWLNGAGSQAQGTKTVYTVSTATWPTSNNGIPSGWTRQNIDN